MAKFGAQHIAVVIGTVNQAGAYARFFEEIGNNCRRSKEEAGSPPAFAQGTMRYREKYEDQCKADVSEFRQSEPRTDGFGCDEIHGGREENPNDYGEEPVH